MFSSKISRSFNDYYTAYYRKAFLFAKSYVHDKYIAEDIASESIIAFWENMRKYEINHPLTFLFSIVKNKSIDYLRLEFKRQETLASLSEVGMREINNRIATLEVCDPEVIYSEEIKTIVNSVLNTLPDKTRRIFLMSRMQNFTKEEIAISFKMTTKGVEYHITNALKPLRTALKDYLPIFYFLFYFQ